MSYQADLFLGPGNANATSKVLRCYSIDEVEGTETLLETDNLAGTAEIGTVELSEGVLHRINLVTTFEGSTSTINRQIRGRENVMQQEVDEGKLDVLSLVAWDNLSSSSSSPSSSSSSSQSSSSSSSG